MLLAWMAYTVLFGALAYGAALAGERLASVWGRSSRFIWFAAVIAVYAPIEVPPVPPAVCVRTVRSASVICGAASAHRTSSCIPVDEFVFT